MHEPSAFAGEPPVPGLDELQATTRSPTTKSEMPDRCPRTRMRSMVPQIVTSLEAD